MDYLFRSATSADTPGIADLINAHSLATVGTRRALFDADGDLRTARYIPGAAEQIVAVAEGEHMAAFAYSIGRPPYVVVEMGYIVSPVHQNVNLGDELLDFLEARAREIVALAPENARVVHQTTVLGDDAFSRALLQDREYQQAREWVHFELDLAEPPIVDLPEGVTIRVMDPRHDWPAVGAAMDAAFADHWSELGPEVRTLLEEDEEEEDASDEADGDDEEELEDDPYSNSLGLCFVAEADGEMIGSCLCNARTIEWPDAGKLGSLSVRRAYRGRGVGHALTASALTEFHRRGIRRIITDTDKASFTGANRLYQRFGFLPYRYELVYEKEMRPGVEWRALSVEDLGS